MWRMVMRWWLVALVVLISGACNAPPGFQVVSDQRSGAFVSGACSAGPSALSCISGSPSSSDAVLLNGLRPLVQSARDRYQSSVHRELFGFSRPYPDLDGDCRNTRDQVLFEEARRVTKISRNGCAIYQGEWFDPFTNKTFHDRSQIEIDHVVSLSDAWNSGAFGWPAQRLVEFGNDPGNLNAIEASENRRKWAHGPARYTPSNVAHSCPYVRQYATTKITWSLTVTPEDFAAIESTLRSC